MDIHNINKLSDKYYTYKGLLIAPASPVLLAPLFSMLTEFTVEGIIGAAGFIIVFVLPISYLSTVIVGIPVFLLLKRLSLLNSITLISSGVVFGGLISYAMGDRGMMHIFTVSVALIVSVSFWLIYTRRSSNMSLKQGPRGQRSAP